jgi:predicted MFS family arabinose efflux permease
LTTKANKILTRDYTFHFISYFLMAAAFYFLLPTLPVYAVNALGANKNQVGYIIGVYALAALIIRPLSGFALDAYGRRSVYLWALGIFTLLMGCYHFAGNFYVLLLIRIFHGFTWGTITTGGSTIAADLIPESRRAEGIGYFGMAMAFSIAFAPYAGDLIMGQDNFDTLFTVAAVVATAAFLLAILVKMPNIKTGETKLSLSKMFEKKVNRLGIVMFMGAFPYAAIISFISIYSDELGIAQGGLFFIFMAIGVILARVFVGKVMDNRGPNGLVFFGLLITVAGLLMMSYIETFWPLMLSGVFVGIGNGIIMPTMQTMAINMVPMERRGAANATFFSAVDLGIGAGSIALGYVAEFFGIASMFFICGLILFLPLLFYFTFVAKHYESNVEKLSQANA